MTTHTDRIRQMGEQADEMAAAALGVGTYERWSDEFASKRDAAFAQLVAEDCARVVEPSDEHRLRPHEYLGAEDGLQMLDNLAEHIRARYSLKP